MKTRSLPPQDSVDQGPRLVVGKPSAAVENHNRTRLLPLRFRADPKLPCPVRHGGAEARARVTAAPLPPHILARPPSLSSLPSASVAPKPNPIGLDPIVLGDRAPSSRARDIAPTSAQKRRQQSRPRNRAAEMHVP